MELNGNDFLEELLAVRTETWETINPLETANNDQLFPSSLNFDGFDHYNSNPLANLPHSSCQSVVYENFSNYSCNTFNDICTPFLEEFSRTQITDSSFNAVGTSLGHAALQNFMAQENQYAYPLMPQEEYPLSLIEEDDPSFQAMDLRNIESPMNCKIEPMQSAEMPVGFNFGICLERKSRTQKLQGQPSKNLMAERRRRKKLNDRLSMLRAIVPKISKMDRTSILGDTIDYMKELLEKINKMQQESEETEVKSNMEGLLNLMTDAKPNEMLVRNSPKFDVEKREEDTRIDICCAGKPGLLQKMVNTLEALGLEIEQCVISCFNDFAMQASCSEELDHRTATSSADIKQTLFRDTGYGGRCL